MFAITIAEPGGPEVLSWSRVPDPTVGPGEVLIDVSASAVNRADLLQRIGRYPPPPGAPPYLGLECCGIVAEVGNGVVGYEPGDQVAALLSGGGYAERVTVPAEQVLAIPRKTDFIAAAALPEAACTVWSNLVDLARLTAGEVLLVHGGGSGIGTFAIQTAAALGACVITTARAVKHPALKQLGAHQVIDYETTDFVAATREASGGRGADVILDIMGGSYLVRNIAALAPRGRLVVIGLQGGRRGELDLSALLAAGGTVSATSLRYRPLAEKARIINGVRQQIWPLVESGAVRPVIFSRMPMRQAAEAHQIIADGNHVGKVVLVNGSS